MTKDDETVTSPCVRRCTLDDNDVCIGCYRSLDEIRDWTRLTAAGRRAVLEQVARRRAASPKPWWLGLERRR